MSVTKQTKKEKQNLILNKIKELRDQITNQPDCLNQEFILSELEKLEELVTHLKEVLRFSDIIVTYKFGSDDDNYFKNLLSKHLYKFYVTT